MNAFCLVLPDDDAAESGAFFEQEYGIGVAAFRLLAACTRATVVAGVWLGRCKRLASENPNGSAQVARGRRSREDIGGSAAFQMHTTRITFVIWAIKGREHSRWVGRDGGSSKSKSEDGLGDHG